MNDNWSLPDYSGSRAVLIGTWEYAHLPPVHAAQNSLQRIKALMTGDLCGWPTKSITVVPNRRKPGDLPDKLMELFSRTDRHGVALFYYVGHGQPDDNDRLCLGLVDSRTEAERRATTSLRFGDVRDALRRSPAETKVLVLDCCFAGLATSPHTLAAGTFEGMVRGSGAYTMAASGPYNTAWFEATEASPRPQTFFTKYLADVIEEGIAGQPPGLTLHEIFSRVQDKLVGDHKPEPTRIIAHDAGRFVFARNAAPAEAQVDHAAENKQLREQVSTLIARLEKLEARYDESERQPQPQTDEAEWEVDKTVSAIAATEAQLRRIFEIAGQQPAGVGSSHGIGARQADLKMSLGDSAADMLTRTSFRRADEGRRAALKLAARTEPVADVVKRMKASRVAGRHAEARTIVRWAAQRPVAEVVELAAALRAANRERDAAALLTSAAARPVAEVGELIAALANAGQGNDAHMLVLSSGRRPVTEVMEFMAALRAADQGADSSLLLNRLIASAAQRPVDGVLELVTALRAAGQDDDADKVLLFDRGWPTADVVRLITVVRSNEKTRDIISALLGDKPRGWADRRAIARALRRASLDEEAWQALLKQNSRRWPKGRARTLGWSVLVSVFAFITGCIISQFRVHPQLGPGNWFAVAVSLILILTAGLSIRASLFVFFSKRRRYHTGWWRLLLLVEACALVLGLLLATKAGMAHLALIIHRERSPGLRGA